jgi:amino acid transporter
MVRVTRTAVLTALILLVLPVVALADDGAVVSDQWLHIVVSLIGLLVAFLLLVETLGVRKVAFGGAVADKISLVILATICLAASALAEWARNFVVDVTLVQAQLASEVLVVAAMALLAAYFYHIRAAMQEYLKAMTGQQMLAEEKVEQFERDREANPAPSVDTKPEAEDADRG